MVTVFNILLVIVCIAYISYVLHTSLQKIPKQVLKIYVVAFTLLHFGMMAVFLYLLNQLANNDAQRFYNTAFQASSWVDLFGLGNRFMAFIIYPFAKLGVTIQVLFLVFSTISFKGFINLFELMNFETLHTKHKLVLILFLTPTIHFWTVSLGKEALLLWLMVALLKIIQLKKYNWQLGLLFTAIFLIRPHVFFVLLLSLFIVVMLDKNTSKKIKQTILRLALLSFIVLSPIFLLFFLKIETLSLAALQNYYTQFMEYTQNRGNAPISIANTTIFTRIFYLLVMPLPFLYELKSYLQWVVAIENIVYVFAFIYVIYYFIRYGCSYNKLSNEFKFALVSSILLIVLFASYLYNVGLGNRMRLMFFPYIFYFLSITLKPTLPKEKT